MASSEASFNSGANFGAQRDPAGTVKHAFGMAHGTKNPGADLNKDSTSPRVELPSSRSFANRAERPVTSHSANGVEKIEPVSPEAFISRLRSKRRAAWGKFQMSTSSEPPEEPSTSRNQLIAEEDAWDVIQKWRRVVTFHFNDTGHAPARKFASLAETLDVEAMEPSQQQQTEEATGIPLPEILKLQEQKQTALLSIMHVHARLVFKVMLLDQFETCACMAVTE